MRIPHILALVGLLVLAAYCAVGLLFTGGGVASGRVLWVPVLGGVPAVGLMLMRHAAGRALGISVYAVGGVYYCAAGLFSELDASVRVFLILIALVNGVGVWALCQPMREAEDREE